MFIHDLSPIALINLHVTLHDRYDRSSHSVCKLVRPENKPLVSDVSWF